MSFGFLLAARFYHNFRIAQQACCKYVFTCGVRRHPRRAGVPPARAWMRARCPRTQEKCEHVLLQREHREPGVPSAPVHRDARRPHRQGYGEPRFPRMFTSVIHAAAPHNDKMNMGFSWEGAALPNPPRRQAMFTSDAHSRGAQRRDEHGASSGGPPPPWPSPAGGGNQAPPRREGIGETWFPRIFTSALGALPARP